MSELMEAATDADLRHVGTYRREDMDRDYFGRALRAIGAGQEIRT